MSISNLKDLDKVIKKIDIEKITWGILAIIIIILFALATRTPEARGESDDYMLATVALENHFSLRITEEDVMDAQKAFPESAWFFASSWETGMPALFSINGKDVYPWYMGTYSLCCIPMKKCLQYLGQNQSYAFPLTNVILVVLALIICMLNLKIPSADKFWLITMLGISPIWGYIRWPSAECFIFSMIVMALCFYTRENFHLAGLFVSLASTMNVAALAMGLLFIIDYVVGTCKKYYSNGECNIIKIMCKERKSIILLIICYLPALITPIFNLINFRMLNLQSILGFATSQGYLNRIVSYLFDLNIGFLPYFNIAFLLFLILSIKNILEKKRTSFVYFFSFIGMVCMYSVTYHINSGMSGLPRYSVWTFPIIAFFLTCDIRRDKMKMKHIYTILLVLSIFITSSFIAKPVSDLGQNWVAEFVENYYPQFYNPYEPIFISRVGLYAGGYTPYQENVPEAIRMGDNYEDYFPVIYCNSEGKVRKILCIPEFTDQLIDYFEGSEDDLNELIKKINTLKADGNMYYINLCGSLRIKDYYLNTKFLHSYGTYLKEGNIPLNLFQVQDGGSIDAECIELPNGAMQYGPYLSLKKGNYYITIKGNKLENINEDILVDNDIYSITELEKTEEVIKYSFCLKNNVSCIEIRAHNEGEDEAVINQIVLERYK